MATVTELPICNECDGLGYYLPGDNPVKPVTCKQCHGVGRK
jgi:DnaJ-class molecular chaperone